MRQTLFIAALLLTAGCHRLDRVVGSLEGRGSMSAEPVGEPIITNNIIYNPHFRGCSSLKGPIETYTPICDGWVSQYGGEGAAAHYTVREDNDGVRFDVAGFDEGELRRGHRIMQIIPDWQQYVGKKLLITVVVRTNIRGHVQFAIDSGVGGDHVGHEYSAMAQGTERYERLVVRFTVPQNAILLWLKIGQTSGFHPEPGWFVVNSATIIVED